MLKTLDSVLFKNTNPVGIKYSTTNLILPPSHFIYGKKMIPDKEDVSIVTRSWEFHSNSKIKNPLNDFIKTNKLAISNNISSHKSNKNFRKTIYIRQSLPEGKKPKAMQLPPQEFTYGLRNRTPTPIKHVVNHNYYNQAEYLSLKKYSNFKIERSKIIKLQAKSTKHFDNLLSKRKEKIIVIDKPLFKIKKYLKINSKLKEHLSNFKTYLPTIKSINSIENMIKMTNEEIQSLNNERTHLKTEGS